MITKSEDDTPQLITRHISHLAYTDNISVMCQGLYMCLSFIMFIYDSHQFMINVCPSIDCTGHEY